MPMPSWAVETTLDVEWVHAVAPGANIVLVVAPTNLFTDLFAGILTAASQRGVVAISNSWSGFDTGTTGSPEPTSSTTRTMVSCRRSALPESRLISAPATRGDNADQLGGLYTSTGWPASSPYATGVGGVSVVLDSSKHIAWQTSWGTELTEIADTVALGSPPIDTLPGPFNEGFYAAARAGSATPIRSRSGSRVSRGTAVARPDISWVADPYTGVEIIYSVDPSNDLGIEVDRRHQRLLSDVHRALGHRDAGAHTICSGRRRRGSIVSRPSRVRSPTS